ncbi:Mss4-like protein [Aspergillus carlsbadensis]|nr:Mss4-like protein [Aspergillus carlsbadensis]
MLCNRIFPARPNSLHTPLLTCYTKLKSRHLGYSAPLHKALTMTERDPGYKDRPPYKIRPDADFGEAKWRGSCHCGQVTYKISRQTPLNAKYCHCRGCQVTHGAPFQWCGIFHKENIMFNKGTEGLSFYSSQDKSRDYQLPTKVACAHCRSPIMDEGRNVCLVFPELIDYKASGTDHDTWRQAFEPKLHIFYGARAMDIPDGKPKWSGLDEQSDMLDDYGKLKDESGRTRM